MEKINQTICHQWHETPYNSFHSESIIYFSMCDKLGNMSLHSLLQLASDTGVEDFKRRNMSRDELVKAGYAILLSRLAFRFHVIPKENQHITIHTIEEKNESLQFIRTYEIEDTDTKQPLISGISSWLLVDIKTRRLLPIKQFTMREPTILQLEHDCPKPKKIASTDNMIQIDSREIRDSDIDANGHVNNARYAAFITDSIVDLPKGLVVKDFFLNFCSEALYKDSLVIFANKAPDTLVKGETLTVIGRVGGKICFESMIVF